MNFRVLRYANTRKLGFEILFFIPNPRLSGLFPTPVPKQTKGIKFKFTSGENIPNVTTCDARRVHP